MATEIKAIKCPQCGSSQKTEIKPQYYRCDSCQTEYFLDDDRRIIQHEHTFQPPPAPTPGPRLSMLQRALLGVAVAGAVLVVSRFNQSSPAGPSPATAAAMAALAAQPPYYASIEKSLPLTGSAQQPLLLVLASRNYRAEGDRAQNGPYVTFHDPLKHEDVATQPLTAAADFDADARTFSDGNHYVIVNKATLYRVDKEALRLVEAGKELFQRQPLLRAGVASMEFVSATNGDGLAVVTNDGKSLFYYPLVNRLYTEEELDEAEEGFNTLLPGAVAKTGFTFTDPSVECKGDKIKLLEFKYKDNGGGPKTVCENVWCDQKNVGMNEDTGAVLYQKVDIGSPERYRITSFRDLTPGRLYFTPVAPGSISEAKPEVLYSDAQQLLIATHTSAAPDSPLSLQCLDPATGRVRWTTPLGKQDEIHSLIPCKEGFVGAGYGPTGIVVSRDGKIISHFNLNA